MFQDDFFPPACEWRPPRVSELPAFRHARRVALDTETRDPGLTTIGSGSIRGDGEVVGFSYAIYGGPRRYVPLAHAGGDNVEDKWAALAWLRDEAAHFTGELIGSKLSYDLCWLLSLGVSFPRATLVDIQVTEALIDELALRYGLEALCARYGLPGKDEELMRQSSATYRLDKMRGGVKGNLWRLPARYVGVYAEADVDRPLLIHAMQEKEVERQNLSAAWALEKRVTPALLAVRRRGIRVDWAHLDRVERYARERIRIALAQVNDLHTQPPLAPTDLNKTEALHRVITAAGIDNPYRSANGKPSVTKEFLEACPGEVGKAIREAKKWDKLVGTFCASVRTHAVNGRVHCYYNQCKGEKLGGDGGSAGAGTHRLSCEDPNLQQQPGRDPEQGPLWRRTYVPDEGSPWCSADFSQQEPRFTTHFAAVMNLPRAREAAERYSRDRSTDNHQMMADLTGGRVKRKAAKEIYLGITYGQGGAKTADKIGLPTSFAARPPREPGQRYDPTVYYRDQDPDGFQQAVRDGGFSWECAGAEARAIIETLDREVPYLKALARAVTKKAERTREIRTFFGHVMHFPRDHPLADDLVRKALNRLIQTSSAGQTKEAVARLHEEGENVQLQVHDELGGSPGDEAGGHRWAQIMEGTARLMLPSKVDAEFGASWGDSMLTPSEPALVAAQARVEQHMRELGI